MEGSAIKQWQYIKEQGYGGLLLDNRIEIVRERRVSQIQEDYESKYSEAGSFPALSNDNKYLFTQPISVLPNSDGTIWVLAYGSNELLLFDVNGTIVNRVTGPLVGFDRPVDIIKMNDGNILITESAGDRLSVLSEKGSFIKYIGKKGRGIGELVGPQYACQDAQGNIYVSDFGNARITVFDKDGNGTIEEDEFLLGMQSYFGIQKHSGSEKYDRMFLIIFKMVDKGGFFRRKTPAGG